MTEREIKRNRVREYLARTSTAAVILTSRAGFAWYSCGHDNHVVAGSENGFTSLIITPDNEYMLTTSIEGPRICAEESMDEVELIEYPWYQEDQRQKLIRELVGDGSLGSDDGTPGSQPLGDDFISLRYSLTDEEVDRFKTLGTDSAQAMSKVCRACKPGMTEYEIAGQLSAAVRAKGIDPMVVLIAADERISQFRHPIPKNNTMQSMMMAVLCAQRHGLIVSLTRLIHAGPLDASLLARHRAVQKVDTALMGATAEGASFGDIFAAGCAAYADTGYADEWQLHHQGGPAGYGARDFLATADEKRTVQLNQAAAWNPSITGTKSEDTIIAGPDGPVIISEDSDWPLFETEYNNMTFARPEILEI